MTGKTHSSGGSLAALIAVVVVQGSVSSVDWVSLLVLITITYPFSMIGSVLPDIDHHLHASPLKDPISVVANKLLHVFNKPYSMLDNTLSNAQKKSNLLYKVSSVLRCVHRSWQTHSEFTLALMFVALNLLSRSNFGVNGIILQYVLTGVIVGFVSHVVLDMLTTDGTPFALGLVLNKVGLKFIPTKIRLVPRSSFFATGTKYEEVVRRIIRFTSFLLIVYIVWQYVLIGVFSIDIPTLSQLVNKIF